MRDGPLRRLVKALVRRVNAFDLAVTRRSMPKPRYRLLGTCNGCGKCCETPGISVRKHIWYLPFSRAVFLWWQRVVNGFHLLKIDKPSRTFFFTCSHYDREKRQCDSYDSRPNMCRDYPYNLTFEAVPPVLEECSYVVQDVNADTLRAELIRAGVSGDKLKEMETKLFLRGEK